MHTLHVWGCYIHILVHAYVPVHAHKHSYRGDKISPIGFKLLSCVAFFQEASNLYNVYTSPIVFAVIQVTTSSMRALTITS